MVNENFWGTKDTWVSYANVLQRPANAVNSYALAYGLNTQSPNPDMHDKLDLSICPWGIGAKSLLNQRYYIAPWIDDGSTFPCDLLPINTEELNKPKPLILNGVKRILNSGGSSWSDAKIMYGNSILQSSYSPDFPEYSSTSTYTDWTNNNVICNFDYSKIVLLPYIFCSTGNTINDTNIFNTTNFSYYTFDDFITNYENKIKGKKVVKGFAWAEYFYNSQTNVRVIQNNSQLQFTIPYTIPSRPSYPEMQYNNNRYPKTETKTMLSTYLASFSNGEKVGFNNSYQCEWLRWYDPCISADKSINFWSGAKYQGIVNLRTTFFDADMFEFYFQPYVSGVNKKGISLIRTENKTAQEIVNYFAKQMAYLGFAFAYNAIDAQSGIVGDNNSICLPVFDSNGITTGEYKQGVECRELPNFTWRDDVYDKNKYNPYQQKNDIDRGDLDNSGRWNMFPATLKVYALDFNGIATLINSLNDIYSTSQQPIEQNMIDFQGSNPSDYIVGLYGTPCELTMLNSPVDNIKIGGALFPGYDASQVNMTANGLFDCGSVRVAAEFGDFRDYEPYTTIELYLPLCGTITLDTAFFVGHTVNVKYTYDVLTMSCTACVYRDGITLYATVNGTIGAELPLSALRMGDYQNAIHSLESAHKQNNIRLATSAIGVGVGAVSLLAAPETGGLSLAAGAGILAGLGGVASGLYQASDINYQISHKHPSLSQTGSADAQNAFSSGSMYPYLFIKRVKMLPEYDDEVYAHTIGHACNINATLDTVSGYTVATNVDLSSFTASSEEKQMISDLLSRGVYL